MKKNHDIITLNCDIRGETDKAFLIEAEMGQAWFPKSQVEVERGGGERGTDSVEMPEWLAIDKGII
jgi:hypothetical protein